MAKFPVSIRELITSQGEDMRVYGHPFAPGKIIVGKLAFKRGEVPAHLESYLIKKGECADVKGTVIYKGKLVPARAKCIAELKKKRK